MDIHACGMTCSKILIGKLSFENPSLWNCDFVLNKQYQDPYDYIYDWICKLWMGKLQYKRLYNSNLFTFRSDNFSFMELKLIEATSNHELQYFNIDLVPFLKCELLPCELDGK